MKQADDPNSQLCLHEKRTASGVWICIRPKHRADCKSAHHTERMRRRRGESVNADRHYMIKRGNGPGQSGPFFRARTLASG